MMVIVLIMVINQTSRLTVAGYNGQDGMLAAMCVLSSFLVRPILKGTEPFISLECPSLGLVFPLLHLVYPTAFLLMLVLLQEIV